MHGVRECSNFIVSHVVVQFSNAGLDEAQAGITIARRNINNLRYADDTTLLAESKELKSLLMNVKEESEKVSQLLANFWLMLNLNIQKTKIMTLVPLLHGNSDRLFFLEVP